MLNKIIVQGRLTKTPDLRKTQSGVSVCTTTLAVERDFKDSQGNKATDFIDVTIWRQTADFFASHFDKGDMAIVEGSLQSRKWTDKNDNPRVSWEIQADSIFFCGNKNRTVEQKPTYQDENFGSREGNGAGFAEIEEDGELPF